jgi:hypothetical protein
MTRNSGDAQATFVAARLSAQLLSGDPARSPTEVVDRLLAVQAQDNRGARLAIRPRSTGLSVEDIDRAVSDHRSLVVTWLNRGTLHLVRSEDYWWLHALTTPQLFTGNARRLREEGVSPEAAERGVAVIQQALTIDGPRTRSQLRERIAAAGVPVEGQALVHLLLLASLRGIAVRGPMVGGEQAYVLVHDWLGEPPQPLDRDVALAELARRYLAGHGPAADSDLARWAGMPLRDARRGLSLIGSALQETTSGLVDLAGRPTSDELPIPRLHGPFDPLLLGWASRDFIVGPDDRRLVTNNGVFRPFALVRGRAVATWRLTGGKIQLQPFAAITSDDLGALEADIGEVLRFLGRPTS